MPSDLPELENYGRVIRIASHRIASTRLTGQRACDDDVVFAKPDGEAVHPDYFSQVFDRHVAKSTLPRIRLHDLRHAHATILLKAGGAGEGRERAPRPQQLAFTMSVYQHVLPGMQADAALAFSEAVFGT